jgi:hypothetical protein
VLLVDSAALFERLTANVALDLLDRGDAHQRLGGDRALDPPEPVRTTGDADGSGRRQVVWHSAAPAP